MLKSVIATAILALSAAPADAEVVVRTQDSFVLRFAAGAGAEIARADIAASLEDLPKWWDSAHTYSGSAANLSLDLTPGGCWCERLADGTEFDHGRTVTAAADRFVIHAPFGPLRGKTTRAELEVSWPEPHGVRTPTWIMTVEGPGVGVMADAVDGVIGAGYQRWLRHIERGPEDAS